MSQHPIVSCPGCGKRYSVPPGAAPGQFQCQDCSAVVAYGRPGAGGQQSHPHGAGGAKKSGRAAAARKKIHDRHAAEGADEGRGRRHAGPPPPQHSPLPYVLGFITLGILVAGTVFLLQKSKTAPPVTNTASVKKGGGEGALPDAGSGEPGIVGAPGMDPLSGAGGVSPVPVPVPVPVSVDPSPTPPPSGGGLRAEPRAAKREKAEDKYAVVDNPPTGGNYGKNQGELLMMLKKGRAEVLIPLDHLPDTTAELRTQIDADVAMIADHDAGSEALRAADRLGKAGRAAIPRILSVAAKLDFSKYKDIRDARDDGVIAQSVDTVMRHITGYEKIPAIQYTPFANLSDFQRNAEEWYVWWFATGYKRATFYQPAEDDQDEEL